MSFSSSWRSGALLAVALSAGPELGALLDARAARFRAIRDGRIVAERRIEGAGSAAEVELPFAIKGGLVCKFP